MPFRSHEEEFESLVIDVWACMPDVYQSDTKLIPILAWMILSLWFRSRDHQSWLMFLCVCQAYTRKDHIDANRLDILLLDIIQIIIILILPSSPCHMPGIYQQRPHWCQSSWHNSTRYDPNIKNYSYLRYGMVPLAPTIFHYFRTFNTTNPPFKK